MILTLEDVWGAAEPPDQYKMVYLRLERQRNRARRRARRSNNWEEYNTITATMSDRLAMITALGEIRIQAEQGAQRLELEHPGVEAFAGLIAFLTWLLSNGGGLLALLQQILAAFGIAITSNSEMTDEEIATQYAQDDKGDEPQEPVS